MAKNPQSPFDLNYSNINNANSPPTEPLKNLPLTKLEKEIMLMKLVNDSKNRGVLKIGEHGNKDVILDSDSESASSRKTKGVAKLICISSCQSVITSKPLQQTREKLSSYLIKKGPIKQKEHLSPSHLSDEKKKYKKKDYSIVFPGMEHSVSLPTSTSNQSHFNGEMSTGTGFNYDNDNNNELIEQVNNYSKGTINKHKRYNQRSNDHPHIRSKYCLGLVKGRIEYSPSYKNINVNNSISLISHSKKTSQSKSSAIFSPFRCMIDKYEIEKESDDNFEREYYDNLIKNKKQDQGGKVTFLRTLDFYDHMKKNQLHLIVFIQSVYRAHLARSNKTKKIILIQSFWRQYWLRSHVYYIINRYYRMNAFMNHFKFFKKDIMKRIKMLYCTSSSFSPATTLVKKKILKGKTMSIQQSQKQTHFGSILTSRNTRGFNENHDLSIETQKEIKVISTIKKLDTTNADDINHINSIRRSLKIDNNLTSIEIKNTTTIKAKIFEIENYEQLFIESKTDKKKYEKLYLDLLKEMKVLKEKIQLKEFDIVDIDKKHSTRFELCGDEGEGRKAKMKSLMKENKQIEFTYEQVKQDLMLNISKCNSLVIMKDFPTRFTKEKMKNIKNENITYYSCKESSFKVMKQIRENAMSIKTIKMNNNKKMLEMISFDMMIKNDKKDNKDNNQVKMLKSKNKSVLNKKTNNDLEEVDNNKDNISGILRNRKKETKTESKVFHVNDLCFIGKELDKTNLYCEHIHHIQLYPLYYQKPFTNLEINKHFFFMQFDPLYNHKPFSNLKPFKCVSLTYCNKLPFNAQSYLINSFNISLISPPLIRIKHFTQKNLYIDQSMSINIRSTYHGKTLKGDWSIEQIDLSQLETKITHNRSKTFNYKISIQKQLSLNYVYVKIRKGKLRKYKSKSVSQSQTDEIDYNNTFNYNTLSARRQLDLSFPDLNQNDQGCYTAIKPNINPSKRFEEIHNEILLLESPIPIKKDNNVNENNETLFQLPLKLNQMYSPQKKENKLKTNKMTMSARFNRFIFNECFNQSSQRMLDFNDVDNDKEANAQDNEIALIKTEQSFEENTMIKERKLQNLVSIQTNEIDIAINALYTQEELTNKILLHDCLKKNGQISLHNEVNQFEFISNFNNHLNSLCLIKNVITKANNKYTLPQVLEYMINKSLVDQNRIIKKIIIKFRQTKTLKYYYDQWKKINQYLIFERRILLKRNESIKIALNPINDIIFTIDKDNDTIRLMKEAQMKHHQDHTFTLIGKNKPIIAIFSNQTSSDNPIRLEFQAIKHCFKILLLEYQKSLSLLSCPVKLIHARRFNKKIHTTLSMLDPNNSLTITDPLYQSFRANQSHHFKDNLLNTISAVENSSYPSWRNSPALKQNKFKFITQVNHKKMRLLLSKFFRKWYNNSLTTKHFLKRINDHNPKYIKKGISIALLRSFTNKKVLLKSIIHWKGCLLHEYKRYNTFNGEGIIQKAIREEKYCNRRQDTISLVNKMLKRNHIHLNMIKCLYSIDSNTNESLVLYYLLKWLMGNKEYNNHHNQYLSDANEITKSHTRVNYIQKKLVSLKRRKVHAKSELIPSLIIHKEMLEDLMPSISNQSEDNRSHLNDQPINISLISLNDKQSSIISDDDNYNTIDKIRIIKKVSKAKKNNESQPFKTKKMKLVKRYNNTELKQQKNIQQPSYTSSNSVLIQSLLRIYHISKKTNLQKAFDTFALQSIGKFPTISKRKIMNIGRKGHQLLRLCFRKWNMIRKDNIAKINSVIMKIFNTRNRRHLGMNMFRWKENAYKKVIINFKRIKKILCVSVPLLKARIKIIELTTLVYHFNKWAMITNLKNIEKEFKPFKGVELQKESSKQIFISKMIIIMRNNCRRTVLNWLMHKE